MTASLGGFTIDKLYADGLHGVTAELSSTYTDKVFQMYCGRQLVGSTNSEDLYRLTGQVLPSLCPSPITIVMCDLVDRDTDFGPLLPRRPWSRYRLNWSAASFPADARWFSIHGSTVAAGAVDYATTLLKTPFSGNGDYSQELPALTGCGLWTFGVVSRDDALPTGNAGTAAELAITADVYPPDVAIDDDDKRLSVSVASGVVTVAFAYDWPT